MKLLLRKTDSRFTGHDLFKYYIKIRPDLSESATEEFYRLRVWCWETWGPSREVNGVRIENRPWITNNYEGDYNRNWSWLYDDYRARIYLAGDHEAALFKLKWS